MKLVEKRLIGLLMDRMLLLMGWRTSHCDVAAVLRGSVSGESAGQPDSRMPIDRGVGFAVANSTVAPIGF